jgi:hypothetical protein
MASGGVAVKADEFNVAAPGANTDILATSLTPSMGGYFQVFVVVGTGSVFNMTDTQGATTFTVGLNKSTALVAGDGYTFSFPVSTDSAYNFRVETDGIIRRLIVLEVSDPAGLTGAQGNAT